MNSLNPLNKRVVAIFFDFFLKLTLVVLNCVHMGKLIRRQNRLRVRGGSRYGEELRWEKMDVHILLM